MKQLISVWQGLPLARKGIVVGATVAIFLAVLGMSRMAANPSFSLLYSGLEPAAAGEVVMALEQRGIAHQVRGSSIFVPQAQRDQLRLTLASEGLPAGGSKGYELLDNISGFGTTTQMFDATYIRAKEGELARTLVSSPDIANARVHIAGGSDNPFRRDLQPSASVHVSGRSGSVDAQQAQAIRHLVAAAVTGLLPENVAIIDSRVGLVDAKDGSVVSSSNEDRSTLLRDRVQRLVEARVGRGNAVVEVSVDTVTDAESIMERRFDPTNRVVISSDTEERTGQSENSGSGGVTVASNLPDGDANGTERQSEQSSETRERLNYEVSETTREILRAPGAIRRLTVAVLVNGSVQTEEDGTTRFVPLPETELEALRELVASAVGFDEARGDDITIRSMAFEGVEEMGTEAAATPWYADALDPMSLIQMAVLAVVALLLGLFVLRPILLSSARNTNTALPKELPRPAGAADNLSSDAGPVLTGTIEPDDATGPLPAVASQSTPLQSPDQNADAVDRLRGLIEERRSETVEILRTWLDEKPTGETR